MKLIKPHPIAEIYPRMSDEDFRRLVLSVEAAGLLEPIVMHEGKILDGRHRHAACLKAGREPKYVEWNGEHETPLKFVHAKNFARRHMNETQRAVAAARALEMFEKDAKTRMKAGTPAPREHKGRAVDRAGEMFKVGGRSVARAKTLLAEASREQIKDLESGALTLGQAENKNRRAEQVEQAHAYVAPDGSYPVIAADPPWQYDDKLQGVERELPYPTMTVEEICALKVPAAPDCVLWLWVTNAHLLDGSAAKVLAAWGFEAKTMLTWAKDKIGMGRWLRGQTEHCILAVKGAPTVDLTNQSTLLSAPRRANSQKPEEFFALVESMCPQFPRLEMFARAERAGWATTGSELPAETQPPMFIDTPARQAAIEAINEGMAKTGNGPICGAVDGKPGKKNGPCIMGATHEGAHSNGYRTWPPKKQRKLFIEDVPPPAPEPTPKESSGGIEWQVISKKTVVPGLEVEKGKKYHVERGELGIGKRTTYLLEPHGRTVSLGIVSDNRSGIVWPGGNRTLDEARAAAVEYERTGEVPPTPDDDEAERAKPIPADEIRWVAKKHPTKVAVGLARSGRRYAIDKFHKTTAAGKKIDGYTYRWFCTSDGASAMGDFDAIEQAQANAGHAEQEYQRLKTSAA